MTLGQLAGHLKFYEFLSKNFLWWWWWLSCHFICVPLKIYSIPKERNKEKNLKKIFSLALQACGEIWYILVEFYVDSFLLDFVWAIKIVKFEISKYINFCIVSFKLIKTIKKTGFKTKKQQQQSIIVGFPNFIVV